jgi:hypothetical protein
MKEFILAMRHHEINNEFELGIESSAPFRYRGYCKVSHPGFGAPRPGREHNHQVCWDQVSHI